MIRTVLVAGGPSAENQATRLCLNNFIKPAWIPPEVTVKTIPKLDAAIVFTSYAKLETYYRVRDAYEGKLMFTVDQGVSKFKEEFEKAVYGPEILKSLRNKETPIRHKFAYILARFFKRGEAFKIADIRPKICKVTHTSEEDFNEEMRGIYLSWTKRGVLEKKSQKEKDGVYIFKGLTDRMYDDLLKSHLFLEKDAKVTKPGDTEILVPNQTVPEDIQPAQPEMFPEPIQTMPAAIEIPAPPAPVPVAAADHAAGLELALDALARQDARVAELTDLVRQLLKRQVAMEDSMMRYHQELFMMAPELKKLDADGLFRARQVLTLFDRDSVPTPIPRARPVVTPATPRSLS